MNRVPHGSTAPKFAIPPEGIYEAQIGNDQGNERSNDWGNEQGLDSSSPDLPTLEPPAMNGSAGAAAADRPLPDVQVPKDTAEDPATAEPPDSALPPSRPTVSAVLALPPIRFLGQLLNQHPTIFWSGVWVITLLCAGIAVTGLMNPDLSSQQEQPDPTGVEAILRATRLDQQKPASPAVSFGLLAVSCAGCCLLLSRRFQQPQALSQPIRKKLRSPTKSTIAAELEAIATLASDATSDSERSLPVSSRQPWIDVALSAVQSQSSSASSASHAMGFQVAQAPQAPQALDYLSYLRVHAQTRAQSQRMSQGEGRSHAPQPPPQTGLLVRSSPPTIAPYTPDPALPVAFLALPSEALSPSPTAQLALPAATQPRLQLSQPPQPQTDGLPDALADPALPLAELRKIQAKRAKKERAE